MTVGEWRRAAALAIKATFDDVAAPIEADVLLGHALHASRTWLYAHSDEPLEPEARREASTLLQRRLAGEPIAYLTGECEFRSRAFIVGPDVLVPRDDTEVLVEVGLRHSVALHELSRQPLRIVDAGTGSGIVAISLALECSVPVRLTALDQSLPALLMAKRNATRLQAHIDFLGGDWLTPLLHGSADLIVANPPYIRIGDAHLHHLASEPRSALVAGRDGLSELERIIEQAVGVLTPGGVLALEHGFDQADQVTACFQRHGYRRIETHLDTGGHERVTAAVR